VFGTWGSNTAASNSDIADGDGDTFTFLRSLDNTVANQSSGLWYTLSSAGGHTDVTFNRADKFTGLIALEVSGLASSSVDDGGSTNNNSAGSSAANGDVATSFSTTVDGDGIFAFFFDSKNNTTTYTAGTSPFNFTIPSNAQNSVYAMAVEWGVQTTHASIAAAITANTTNNFDAVVGAFKAATVVVPVIQMMTVADQSMVGSCI
jgi:hypothetical protein